MRCSEKACSQEVQLQKVPVPFPGHCQRLQSLGKATGSSASSISWQPQGEGAWLSI